MSAKLKLKTVSKGRGGPGMVLPVLCLLALAGGVALCLWRAGFHARPGLYVSPPPPLAPLVREAPEPLPVPPEEAPAFDAPFDALEPEPPAPAPIENAGEAPKPGQAERAKQPETGAAEKKVEAKAGKKPDKKSGDKRSGKKPKGLDLSAYDVKAASGDRGGLLPKDKSLSAQELGSRVNSGKKAPYDGGRGLLGDAYRGVKRLAESVDGAALTASQKALGPVAKPDSAKIRPYGGGVRLQIKISPENVAIQKKRGKK